MKTNLLLTAVAGLALLGGNLSAQTTTPDAGNAPAAPAPVVTTSAAPPLAYGVPQVIQLAQAKVSDDTIVTYIRNSGNSYGLNADQIIYLRQQGVSDNVINVMLNQPKVAAAQPAPQADVTTVYAQPTTTVVQAAPAPSTVYVIPDTQTYYYNSYYARPYYGYYGYPYYGPSVSIGFGFGGGYRGGYGGGYYHGGGGYRGGGWHH